MNAPRDKERSNSRPVAMVTGAGARIGAAIVRHLHEQGFDILLHFNQTQEAALSLAMTLNTRREKSVHVLQADLRDMEQLRKLARGCLSHWGRLDVLVNNAASFYPTPLDQATENDWHALMGSNAMAPLFLTRELLGALRKSRGSVINLIDIYAHGGLRDHCIYTMSKAALANLTRSLARELAPQVRVNGVAPGAILWPDAAGQAPSEERKREVLGETCLQRLGDPEDIARAVHFLVRQEYITGQILNVDGGRSLKL